MSDKQDTREMLVSGNVFKTMLTLSVPAVLGCSMSLRVKLMLFRQNTYKNAKIPIFVGKITQVFSKSVFKTTRIWHFKKKNTYKSRIFRNFVGKIIIYIIKSFLQKQTFFNYCRKNLSKISFFV